MAAEPARIVLVGAESTGKTTLARELTEHFRARGGDWADTRWVPEYGREYTELLLERQGAVAAEGEAASAEWTAVDFVRIALEQQRREDAAAASTRSPVLFCDTDAFATQVWERRYLGPGSTAAFDALPVLPPRALYLLADVHGVPFEQDGIRDGENLREAMQGWFVEELEARREPWALVTGSREERLATSIRLVDEALAFATD
ncbi:ATP-binding protein [Leifsonia sp. H3M29-4]|uniref:ATP-binding protein n=1 Tax=Salinibacterium metalliresistens TaxID=3031321 RepID=UPI0023D99C5E|nr:ATP-binding protein [Salinibacterium metalliresistens]MDF1478446.1 ATP-binding protein [Salinibacterium metalliresistens]